MLDSSYSEVLGCSELTGADQMSKNTTLNNSETNGQGIDECGAEMDHYGLSYRYKQGRRHTPSQTCAISTSFTADPCVQIGRHAT